MMFQIIAVYEVFHSRPVTGVSDALISCLIGWKFNVYILNYGDWCSDQIIIALLCFYIMFNVCNVYVCSMTLTI